MEQEIWKDIKGFEGFYKISNLGRVKSLERTYKTRNNKTWHVGEKILKIVPFHGYPAVVLSKNSVCRRYTIHRLIAEAFIPNPENKPYIDHIDTNPKNNTVSLNCDGSVDVSKTNLRWVTCKENSNNPLTVKHIKDACTEENIKKQIQSKKNNGTWQGRCVYQYDMNGVFVAAKIEK